MIVLTVLITLAFSFLEVQGHGRLINPPSRSSMWREGFENPVNYNDNSLFCGGFSNQWYMNQGKCGICGDPYQGPRHNEAGGKYANGIITRTYSEGSPIEVTIELTAAHKGWFQFRICPNNNASRPATQECLDRYLLPMTNNLGDTYNVEFVTGKYKIYLQLPRGLTCSQCVFQWKYHTGNSWGRDPDGTSCVGCGPQEEFYGCADVAIEPHDNSVPFVTYHTPSPSPASQPSPSPSSKAPATSHQAPVVADTTCIALGPWSSNDKMAEWCQNNCALGYCPDAICLCSSQRSSTTLPPLPPSILATLFTTPASTDHNNHVPQNPTPTKTSPPAKPSEVTQVTNPSPIFAGAPCKAIGPWEGQGYVDAWCMEKCLANICADDYCSCSRKLNSQNTGLVCRGADRFEDYSTMADWCAVKCAEHNFEYCIPTICDCYLDSAQTTVQGPWYPPGVHQERTNNGVPKWFTEPRNAFDPWTGDGSFPSFPDGPDHSRPRHGFTGGMHDQWLSSRGPMQRNTQVSWGALTGRNSPYRTSDPWFGNARRGEPFTKPLFPFPGEMTHDNTWRFPTESRAVVNSPWKEQHGTSKRITPEEVFFKPTEAAAPYTENWSPDYELRAITDVIYSSELPACTKYIAIGQHSGNSVIDSFCQMRCIGGNCPEEVCICASRPATNKCQASTLYSKLPGFDDFCQRYCIFVPCPDKYCTCG